MDVAAVLATRARHKVKVLDVSNCIVAAPDVILYLVGTCSTLTELLCVNCPLPYTPFLIVLMERLPHLHRLDWSFFGRNHMDDHMHRLTALYNEKAIPQLRSTYVEVACKGADNHELLFFLLQRCIVLQKLHLHSVYDDFTEATATWIGTATLARAFDPIFVYTTELDTVRGRKWFCSLFIQLLLKPSNWFAGACVFGNLLCLRASTAGASSSHSHAMPPSILHPLCKQVIVALSYEAGVETTLLKAASEMTWTHIEALTLALLPYAESATPTCSDSKFRAPLITFLSSFRDLTELNLTSFHFSEGVDVCEILAAVTLRLRALSLTPCGINGGHSFINLAKVSSKLEELDVRMNSDNVSLFCASCHQPFRVGTNEAAFLQQHSPLRRFSLCNVATVLSLDFIGQLRPSELRLSFTDWYTIAVTCNIGYLLGWNYNLRSLVLTDRALFRGLQFYQQSLDVLSGLNHLSLDVAMLTVDGEVWDFCNHMTARLPLLESLHLHYVGVDNLARTLTWLRKPAWHRETSQQGGQPLGALLTDRPCIGCSMATFIGMHKPRNRRHNCL
ncbi:hypothetical protein HPB48_007797 [Haemaphysalis longicornis]|uniref:Uncharacterized protein n=1 Tax=Haemaphysalis longicornis TaxID=44386 RepID=A0A9J6FLD9_HAELO|nr:hypothetical protein HPB48_007797 [Haemaphysalis longicornis]